jgi:hypothetical protein
VRAIVLLLAVLMWAGVAGHVASASPDVICAVDDVPDVDAPALVESAVMLPSERPPAIRVDAPRASTRGRMHAVLVFRPPRLLASR